MRFIIFKLFYIISFACVLTLTGCTSLFYHPVAQDLIDTQKIPAQPEDITFETADHKKLHGWYFKNTEHPDHPYGKFLFFHGNSQNITSQFEALYWVLNFGYDFFIFDYEGFGKSEGSTSPKHTVEDGKAALAWINARNPKVPLVVFGQSLGGAIALRVVGEMRPQYPIRLMIVDSTFESYQTMGASFLSRSWVTWLFQPLSYVLIDNSQSPSPWIEKISPVPLTVINGNDDHVVEYSHGEKVFELAKEPKQFWKIEGGHHADMMYRENGKYAKMFLDYVDKQLGVGPRSN